MVIICPSCKNRYDVSPDLIGQTIPCPVCKKVIKAENPNLFACPDCFSLISKRAAVCPKCGAVLSSRSNVSEGKDLSAEKTINVYHPSAMNYFWPIVAGIISIPILIGIYLLITTLIEIHCTSYILTSRRIIVKKGWISKVQNEIWIKDVRAVNLIQGVWQRIAGFGDIAIGTAATSGNEICLVGIARPDKVIAEINSLRGN